MQQRAAVDAAAPAAFSVEGPINFDNLMAVRRAGEQYISDRAADGAVSVDLAGAVGSGSAAAAVLTAWLRRATQVGSELVLLNLPADLLDLLRVSGLDEVLPLGEPS